MRLAHVLWIGGATDSGKSTIAQYIGEHYNLPVYHYDHHDLAHHEELALTDPQIQAYLDASLDERWVQQTPESLLQRSLNSFQYRFPLVRRDLEVLASEKWVVAEGFGLTPELVIPHLPTQQQAIWLVPSRDFKLASVERRNKAAWRFKTSDPKRGKSNLINRDLLLADYYRQETAKHEVRCVEVDAQSIDEMIELVCAHFKPFLSPQS